ncbi:potassium-transporting ATPase subunit F [Gloeocapsa sp. PCC 73106]|uniref:potassium-transporting ATPase subunit F n=1 Tax=Gloeocapsa sp. PCC 73106 TaxID=102232 RepID=UPI0002ACF61F|nr:potassium-transporting ATPase subunit F [Gloeocapsa sp. PCC 73106]ELR99888.1 F subunit of K+-transporting ATPase [Gloeocapsa sp. PCC 73106]
MKLIHLRYKFPLAIFLSLCLNILIAPAILAAGGITRANAYALGLLVILTLAIAIYLFAVIFQPEKF